MSKVGRLAGAILAESNGEVFLVGDTKAPCDWASAGFEPPVKLEPTTPPFVRLALLAGRGAAAVGSPYLTLDLEGEELARALVQRFVIERNGSVSDRLWRLVLHGGDTEATASPAGAVDARWLGAIPAPVWQVIRDTVLRCT